MSIQIQRQRQQYSSSRYYEQYPGTDNERIDNKTMEVIHAAQKIVEFADATQAEIDTLLAELDQSE